MKYFLTGATGFVGGYLAKLLRTEGHEVVAPLQMQVSLKPSAAPSLKAT